MVEQFSKPSINVEQFYAFVLPFSFTNVPFLVKPAWDRTQGKVLTDLRGVVRLLYMIRRSSGLIKVTKESIMEQLNEKGLKIIPHRLVQVV
jgi:hypothetical protein